MMDKLEVPRRKVRKDWYVGLNPDPVDRSHPDVHDNSIAKEAASKESPTIEQNKSGILEYAMGNVFLYLLIERNVFFCFCIT